MIHGYENPFNECNGDNLLEERFGSYDPEHSVHGYDYDCDDNDFDYYDNDTDYGHGHEDDV